MSNFEIGNLVWKISGQSDALDTNLKKSQSKITAFGRSADKVGKNLSLKLTLPLVALGAVALKVAGNIETQKVAFGKLLQDVEKGNKLFEELKKFSAETPLQLDDITKGAQKLLAFGVSAEDVQEKLRRLGDLALGNSEKVGRLTNAYGKLKAKGKATLEELNMFTEAGVPLMDALAKQYGKTTQEMFKLIETGKVGFEDVDEALTTLTDSGGQFNGVMEAIAETTEGKLSTTIDNLKLSMADLGAVMLPTVKEILDGVIDLAKGFQGLDEGTKELIVKIALFVGAVGPLLIGIGKVITIIPTLKTAFLGLRTAMIAVQGAMGPLGIALAVLAIGLPIIIKNFGGLELKSADLKKITKDLTAVTDNYNASLKELNDKTKTATVNQREYLKATVAINKAKALEELQKLSDQWDNVNKSLADATKVYTQLNIVELENINGQEKILNAWEVNAKAISNFNGEMDDSIELITGFDKKTGFLIRKEVEYSEALDIQKKVLREINDARIKSAGGLGEYNQLVDKAIRLEGALGIKIEDIISDENVLHDINLRKNQLLNREVSLVSKLTKEALKLGIPKKELLDLDSKEIQNLITKQKLKQKEGDETGVLKTLSEWKRKLLDLEIEQLENSGKFKEASDKKLQLLQDERKSELDGFKGTAEEKDEIATYYTERAKQLSNELKEQVKEDELEKVAFIIDTTTELLNGLNNLNQAITGKRLEDLDAEKQRALEDAGVAEETELERAEKALALLDDTATKEEKIEAESAVTKAKIEEDFAKKKAKIEYEGALVSWTISGSIIGLKLAEAISVAIASAPFPLNIPAVTFASVLGGTQVGAWGLSKPKKPQFREGVFDIRQDTDAIIHQGESIITKPITDSIKDGEIALTGSKGAVGTNLTVQIVGQDKTVLYEKMYDDAKNGILVIPESALVVI